MRYQMKTWSDISVILHTTVGPQCDVIQSNFAFGVGVALHLHRVHILVCKLNSAAMIVLTALAPAAT